MARSVAFRALDAAEAGEDLHGRDHEASVVVGVQGSRMAIKQCPRCAGQYVLSATRCPDCDVDLVEVLAGDIQADRSRGADHRRRHRPAGERTRLDPGIEDGSRRRSPGGR